MELTTVPDCKLLFPHEIMWLEVPVKPADRSEKLEVVMDTPVQRNNPPKCGVCLDNERKKCKEWDSLKCGGKNCLDSSVMLLTSSPPTREPICLNIITEDGGPGC